MMFTLNFHEFLHAVYKYVLNSVVKISMMFAKYFEYYTIILKGAVFSWTCCNFWLSIGYNFGCIDSWRHAV